MIIERKLIRLKEGENLLFLIKRKSNTIYVALKPEADDDRRLTSV